MKIEQAIEVNNVMKEWDKINDAQMNMAVYPTELQIVTYNELGIIVKVMKIDDAMLSVIEAELRRRERRIERTIKAL